MKRALATMKNDGAAETFLGTSQRWEAGFHTRLDSYSSSTLFRMQSCLATATSSSSSYAPHHRIVLLFDLDCFYAQCERVRLGLDPQVSLALLQWNSVLAVTYPAREYGIQRGDSWEEVAEKSNGKCWAIHLHVLEMASSDSATTTTATKNNNTTTTTAVTTTTSTATKAPTVKNPYLKQSTKPAAESTDENDDQPSCSTTTAVTPSLDVSHDNDANNQDHDDEPIIANIEEAYNQIYKLSREDQLQCQQTERGVRRFHHQGKACLERYRLASMRIFSVVLESLTQRLGSKDKFTLERASIDEFYLDITKYCYQDSTLTLQDMKHQTVIVGQEQGHENSSGYETNDPQRLALQRACQVSHWIRKDVMDILGFTMSAGICTNKMMAKLAASYGKPDGQAVLHPDQFPTVLHKTKIRKVRHFGGKQGKQVLRILQEQSENQGVHFDKDAATMGDLQQVPLPVLQKHFHEDTAHFIFDACRGVDLEAVRETTGALVKSITAFKSFPATSLLTEIQNWITLMSNEVVTRVAKDSVRNRRYPKTCTLNYDYYETTSGRRPAGATSGRNFRTAKSIRLNFPHERSNQKVADLVQQAMEKLHPILQKHPLRGVGLAVSNFEPRGCPPEGAQGITTFLVKKDEMVATDRVKPVLSSGAARLSAKRKPVIEQFFSQQQQQQQQQEELEKDEAGTPCNRTTTPNSNSPLQEQPRNNDKDEPHCAGDTEGEVEGSKGSDPSLHLPKSQADEDEEFAKKLQASFDRENYVLSAANRFRSKGRSTGAQKSLPAHQPPPKVRRIDSFFGRK